jgi:hypothetical protein
MSLEEGPTRDLNHRQRKRNLPGRHAGPWPFQATVFPPFRIERLVQEEVSGRVPVTEGAILGANQFVLLRPGRRRNRSRAPCDQESSRCLLVLRRERVCVFHKWRLPQVISAGGRQLANKRASGTYSNQRELPCWIG